MNCQQFEQLLDEYLNGELQGSFKLELEAHVVECESCGHLMAMMQAVGQIIADPAPNEPQLGGDFAEKVLVGLTERHRNSRRNWSDFAWAGALARAAAVLLVVTSSIWLAWPRRTDPSAGQPTARLARHPEQRLVGRIGEAGVNSDGGQVPVGRAGVSIVADTRIDAPGLQGRKDLELNRAALDNAVLDHQAHIQVQLELRDWLASTVLEAGLTIYHIRQLPDLALGEIREAVIHGITGREMLDQPMTPAAVPPMPLPADMPAEQLSGDGDYELI